MLTETLTRLFRRDLEKLKDELQQYHDERNIWRVTPDIKNSAGNLCLHLVGNLNTYIGANLGQSGYVRHRELEFSLKHIPRATLLSSIDDTIAIIADTLPNIKATEEEYPEVIWDQRTSIEYVLVHLATHLDYHLGQVNYHRRLLDVKDPE